MQPSPLEATAASLHADAGISGPNVIAAVDRSSAQVATVDIGGPVTVFKAGNKFLMWSPAEILRLRSKGHLAVTPIGMCSVKTATRGKAAAVPVMLSDEELYTCWQNGWARVLDESGKQFDVGGYLRQSLSCDVTGEMLLKRIVFYDLWSKGYCCTNGLKFGVHYLTYRGDPTSVHAAFMVIVSREGDGIATLDLVARSRVATTALKICVMAWADTSSTSGVHASDDASASGLPTGGAGTVDGTVRYAAFRRMGPGTAIFADAAAQEAGRMAGNEYSYGNDPRQAPADNWAQQSDGWQQPAVGSGQQQQQTGGPVAASSVCHDASVASDGWESAALPARLAGDNTAATGEFADHGAGIGTAGSSSNAYVIDGAAVALMDES